MKRARSLLCVCLTLALLLCMLPAAHAIMDYCPNMPGSVHTPDSGVVTVMPTCANEGLRVYSCIYCGMVMYTETLPRTNHSIVTVPGSPATCTEPGVTEGQVCSVCGTVFSGRQGIPATGHAWNEGVVTEPAGLTPGKKTYTCQYCGLTWSERLDPTVTLFNMLRTGNPLPVTSGDPLHIVTQPLGGAASEENPLFLYVGAEGGVGAYTYEWWYEPLLPGMNHSVLADLIQSQGIQTVGDVQEAKQRVNAGLAALANAWKEAHGIDAKPVEPAAGPVTAAAEMETAELDFGSLFATCLGSSSEPDLPVTSAGTYWCVVRDESGQSATSEKAKVIRDVYITVQPKNTNLYGFESVTLSCAAAGGSGNYSYTWYDGNGRVVCDERVFVADEVGNYYCLVADYDTLGTAESEYALVYSGERDLRPVVIEQPKNIEMEYREDGAYSWTLSCLAQNCDGESSDLEYAWFIRSSAGWSRLASGETLSRNFRAGIFKCRVTDTRTGQSVDSREAAVWVKMTADAEYLGREYKENVPYEYGAPGLYSYTIRGGIPPYTVSLYTWYFSEGTPDPGPFLLSTRTVETAEELDPLTLTLPRINIHPVERDGEKFMLAALATYYVVVTDAAGNSVQSPIIWSEWD